MSKWKKLQLFLYFSCKINNSEEVTDYGGYICPMSPTPTLLEYKFIVRFTENISITSLTNTLISTRSFVLDIGLFCVPVKLLCVNFGEKNETESLLELNYEIVCNI